MQQLRWIKILHMSQPTVNACSHIKCPFFEIKPALGRCSRYSHPDQCHLNTMFEVESDGYWLFTTHENELPQLKKANDRFLSRDKASRKQLEQLRAKGSRKLELPIPYPVTPPATDNKLQPET